MRRGFKAEAERRSQAARSAMGLGPCDRLDPWDYAKSLGVILLDFETLGLPESHKAQLLATDPESWSGLTLKEGDRHFVVLNPSDTKPRQCSTLMHELSHIILMHRPARVDLSIGGLMLLSDYPEEFEQEADWLSAALLLPREALVRSRSAGMSTLEICENYGVSSQLCEWRLRMTGVSSQMARRRY